MGILQKIVAAKEDNGKAVWRQVSEALRLRLALAPIGIGEYFDYGMYRKSITQPRLAEFIGWRESGALDRLLNDNNSRVLANDKLLNYLVLRAVGAPTPKPVASYTVSGRQIDDEVVLRTIDEVQEFLKGDVYPFYVKPVSAGYGRGVFGVLKREGGSVRLLDGRLMGLDRFLLPFSFAPFSGMLFQKPLTAHAAIAELTGATAVSCVRVIVFVAPAGPVIHTAFWKVTVGSNMLDNFSHGMFGNCLAEVDVQAGVVVRAIRKMGPGGEVERHRASRWWASRFRIGTEPSRLCAQSVGTFPACDCRIGTSRYVRRGRYCLSSTLNRSWLFRKRFRVVV